jgi:hypothetical protein
MALQNDGKMLERISKQMNSNTKREADSAKRDVSKTKARLCELDKVFAKLYEDRVNDVITERNYSNLSAGYEREQTDLESKIAELERVIDGNRESVLNAEMFVQGMKDCAEITELSAALLNRLIERVVVDEAEVTDGERVQRISIFYKFVGNLGG